MTTTARLIASVTLVLVGAASGGTDEAARPQWYNPSPQPPDTTPHAATQKAEPARLDHDSVEAGGLKGIRALSIREGEAQVVVGGATRTVRAGDRIGKDVVQRVDATRIVLLRPADGSAGEATVVVSFDGAGRSRIRVYATVRKSGGTHPEVR
jgi:hypothetical protein